MGGREQADKAGRGAGKGGSYTHGGYIHGGGLGRIVSICVVSLERTLKEVSLGTHGGTLKERDRPRSTIGRGRLPTRRPRLLYSKMAEKNEGDDLMGR